MQQKKTLTQEQKTLRRKRLSALILLFGLILASLLLYYIWGRPLIRSIADPDQAQAFALQNPVGSRIAYVLLMTVQVIVAIIPGEPLEIGAGYAFGAYQGALICLVGITLGALLVFLAVKQFGRSLVELLYPAEKIDSIRIFNDPKKLNTLAFIVFLIPGTPKDLLTYVAGLTPMKLGTWMFITSVARLPSVITSTIAGAAINEKQYGTVILVFALAAVLALAGYGVWYKLNQKKAAGKDRPKDQDSS